MRFSWWILIWWEFKIISAFFLLLGNFSQKNHFKHQSRSAIICYKKKRSPRSIFKYKHSPLASADQSQTIIASYTFTKMFIVFINKFLSCHRRPFLQIFSHYEFFSIDFKHYPMYSAHYTHSLLSFDHPKNYFRL